MIDLITYIPLVPEPGGGGVLAVLDAPHRRGERAAAGGRGGAVCCWVGLGGHVGGHDELWLMFHRVIDPLL